jgi:hypothetical protein
MNISDNINVLNCKIDEINNYLINYGVGYNIKVLKLFNILYGLKKKENKLFDKVIKKKSECIYENLLKIANDNKDEILNELILGNMIKTIPDNEFKEIVFCEIPQNIKGYVFAYLVKEIDRITIIENTKTKTFIVIFDNTDEKTTEDKFSNLISEGYTEDKFIKILGDIFIIENINNVVVSDKIVRQINKDISDESVISSLNNNQKQNKNLIFNGEIFFVGEIIHIGEILFFILFTIFFIVSSNKIFHILILIILLRR